MALENVDNRFEQPVGGGTDNVLVIGGTFQTSTGADLNATRLHVTMDDIASISTLFVSPGFACTFIKLTCIISGAFTGNDGIFDTFIDGLAVTDGMITITAGQSSEGLVRMTIPSALNILTATQGIKITHGGGSIGGVSATFVFEFVPD